MSSVKTRKYVRKTKRSKTRSFVNDTTAKDYAIAVDRFFQGFPNKNSLFKVATKEEEHEAIERFKNDRPSLENFLMTHNIFLAINLASHYSRMYIDYNELISNAMFGLSEAAKRFRPEKNVRFNTYASNWILKYIKYPFYNDTYNKRITANTSTYIDSADFQKEREDENCPCYNSFINSIEPTYQHNITALRTPVDEIDKKFDDATRESLINKITASVNASSLSSTDKRVYSKLFLDGKQIVDVSKDIGVSAMMVIKSKQRITEYISKNFLTDSKMYNLSKEQNILCQKTKNQTEEYSHSHTA
jgi:RNA polymerase sigma factor (sigma-70 family)